MIINTSKQIRPVGGAVLIRKSDHKVLAHRPRLPRIIRDGISSSLLFLLFMAILLQSFFTTFDFFPLGIMLNVLLLNYD